MERGLLFYRAYSRIIIIYKSQPFGIFRRAQRVDKVDTLIRRTKMDAGEEARSRQYKGTAMSDDEASKVCKIAAFGIYDKSYRNKNAH